MAEENNFNINFDLGHLMVSDSRPFKKEDINEDDITMRAKDNVVALFQTMFKMVKVQRGEDDENRDFDKAPDNLTLPKPNTILPRSKPVPKEKTLSRWEKFRKEKGIAEKKRSRMVYSELAKDWVPRWGKGSAKQLENKAEWAIEEKPGMENTNPFELKGKEKKLRKLKQEKSERKNQERRTNDENQKPSAKGKKNRKQTRSENEIKKLDADKKNLSKTLETVQKSTASMGKFDKKLKNEKEINKIKKKKVDTDVLLNRKHERNRDKTILSGILKKMK